MTVELPGWVPGEDVIAAERAVLGAAISSQQGAEAAASVLQGFRECGCALHNPNMI